jgi:hypothetical protein
VPMSFSKPRSQSPPHSHPRRAQQPTLDEPNISDKKIHTAEKPSVPSRSSPPPPVPPSIVTKTTKSLSDAWASLGGKPSKSTHARKKRKAKLSEQP